MVWMVVRQEKDHEFMIECTLDTPVEDLTRNLANIYNLRVRMIKLCEELDRVPAPKTDDNTMEQIAENPAYLTLKKQISDTKSHLSSVIKVFAHFKTQAEKKINTSLAIEEEQFKLLKAAITIAFPQGFFEEHPVSQLLQDKSWQTAKEFLDPESYIFWYANKEMKRVGNVSTYLGKNEKTKIIGRLQKKGHGPPVRDLFTDQQAEKEMMAFYYKKQEQQKKLLEDNEDSYVNSDWANPKGMKNSFLGLQNISWKPK